MSPPTDTITPPRLWLIASGLLIVYTVLTLSATITHYQPTADGYGPAEMVLDGISLVVAGVLSYGLVRGRRWAFVGTLILTGFRFLWRALILGVGYSKHIYSGPPSTPATLSFLLLGGILACLLAAAPSPSPDGAP